MKFIIYDIELFKSLIDFNLEGYYIDLHNNSLCIRIEHMEKEQKISLVFFNNAHSVYLNLVFDKVNLVKKFNFEIGKEGIRLDNMYRGRFEVGQKLYELTDDFCGYIYIDFYKGQEMEFFTKSFNINII